MPHWLMLLVSLASALCWSVIQQTLLKQGITFHKYMFYCCNIQYAAADDDVDHNCL